METITIAKIKEYLLTDKRYKPKEINGIAKAEANNIKGFIWYAKQVIKEFKAEVVINENEIFFRYPKGESIISLNPVYKKFLLPEIKALLNQ